MPMRSQTMVAASSPATRIRIAENETATVATTSAIPGVGARVRVATPVTGGARAPAPVVDPNSHRGPRGCRPSSIAQVRVATASISARSWVTSTIAPGYFTSAASRTSWAGMSRWLVGSSRSRRLVSSMRELAHHQARTLAAAEVADQLEHVVAAEQQRPEQRACALLADRMGRRAGPRARCARRRRQARRRPHARWIDRGPAGTGGARCAGRASACPRAAADLRQACGAASTCRCRWVR